MVPAEGYRQFGGRRSLNAADFAAKVASGLTRTGTVSGSCSSKVTGVSRFCRLFRRRILTSGDGEETQLPTIPAMTTRLLGRLAALTVAMAMLIWSAPVIQAQPEDDPGPAAADLTLSLDDLGADTTLGFYGETSSTSLSFPVPIGLFPISLNATLDLPFNIRSGTVTVTQENRLIGKVGLPLTDLAPLIIPLGGVEIVNESVSVTLRLTALADDGYCLDHLNPVNFFDSSITFGGEELAPTTVADFLPPILRAATIAVPATPSEAESEAAVQLAAALQMRYRGQDPQLALVSLSDGATTFDSPAQPMERQIVIKEGIAEGISLTGAAGVPDLLISGPPDQLTNYGRLLAEGSLNMAVSTTVIPSDLRSKEIPLPGATTTLAELGQPILTAAGLAPEVGIGLDQTRFGHPTQGFRVHLKGTYTPISENFGSQVTASVGGEIIDSWSTDAGGKIDRWVEIPDRLVLRYTNLVVGVETSGITGRCGEFRPIKLAINGSTVVESTAAERPIPTGFMSLPQALMPRMQVGISVNSFADTLRATQIAVGLQRLSVAPLLFEVTSLEQAIDGEDPAILVSADGWSDTSIALPVSADDRRLDLVSFDAGGEETAESTLTLDPGIQFGSLQTVFDGKRSLLIATSNGAAGQLDELLRWLTSDPSRWSKLRGNVVVAVAGREPQMVPDRDSLSVYGPLTSPTAQETSTPGANRIPRRWVALGVGTAVVILVGIVAFKLGTRRPQSGSAESPRDDEEHS